MTDWILTSSVLIVAILFIRKLFGEKLSPGLQYGLWLFVLLRLLLPVSFSGGSYSLPALAESAEAWAAEKMAETDGEYTEDIVSEFLEESEISQTGAEEITDHTFVPAEKGRGTERLFFGGSAVFYLIWMIGMAVTGGIFLLSNLFFRVRIYSDREEIEEELEEMGLASGIPVYVSDFVATTCLAGLKKPAVYIPLSIWEKNVESKADSEKKRRELDAMICHENVHFQHGDQLWGFLRLLCLVVHWYNPFVWAAALASRQDAELFCDAGTVRKLGEENRCEYGRLLLDMTVQEDSYGSLSDSLRHAGFCNTEMTDTKKKMERRIRKLTAAPKKNRIAVAAVLFLGMSVFVYVFAGKEGQEGIFESISNRSGAEQGEVVITRIASQEEEAEDSFYPGEEETEKLREAALAGMSEEEIGALTDYVKNYHNWLEGRLLYDNWERRLSDKESAAWNFIDQTGEVVAGWYLEEDLNGYGDIEGEEERRAYLQEKYPEFGEVSLEELGKKYGEPYYRESWYGAETVIQRMRELTASAENEIFRSDVEALCSALQQAKDTHEVDYVMEAHEILHDMEYFLLRYSPRDVATYPQDKSLSGKYYGALEVWAAWREGRL